MTRIAPAILMLLALTGCVEFTGTTELRFADQNQYAGKVTSRPGFLLFGIPGHAMVGRQYTVADCFDQQRQAAAKSDDLVPTVGADPLKRVCRQYPNVDLATYPAETLKCFPVTDVDGVAEYAHPWLAEQTDAMCSTLAAELQTPELRVK